MNEQKTIIKSNLQKLVDNFKNPQNFFELENFDLQIPVKKTSCGDDFKIFIKLNDNNDNNKQVKEISFTGHGCSVSTAGISILTEFLKNKNFTTSEIKELSDDVFLKYLDVKLNPAKKQCYLLGFVSLKSFF